MSEAWAELPPKLREALLRGATGEVPAPVAVMQLCAKASEEAEVERAVAALRAWLAAAPPAGDFADRARAMLVLLQDNPRAWRITKSVLADAEHNRAPLRRRETEALSARPAAPRENLGLRDRALDLR